jgi:hypothetical protein
MTFLDEQRFDFIDAHVFKRLGRRTRAGNDQVAGLDFLTAAQQHGALDCVLKLAHIAGPGILKHVAHCGRREILLTCLR